MIERVYVERVARAHITAVLAQYPGSLQVVFIPQRWQRWTELCTERLNQILEFLAGGPGKKPTKIMVDDFVHEAVRAYARKSLNKFCAYNGLAEGEQPTPEQVIQTASAAFEETLN